MDASAASGIEASTGSKTIADLLPLAAEPLRDRVAVRVKRDGTWQDVTFGEVGAIAEEIALGLVELGIQPGDRVAHPLPHASRVDQLRLRRDRGRRRRRADLPDQLSRGVRVGRCPTPALARSSARTPSRSRRSRRSARDCRSSST